MKKLFLAFIILTTFSATADAQLNRYIVRLKNKSFNTFSISNPSQYLTARALQRRTRYNIAIDSTDLPVTQRYIDSIKMAGAVTIINASKWLNQVCIYTTDGAALAKINSFSFVINATPIAPLIAPKTETSDFKFGNPSEQQPLDTDGPAGAGGINGHYNYGLSGGQVRLHNGDFLHNHGFRGEGMHMAVLDAGFYHYLSLPTFDSVRMQNRVLGTWDFVTNDANVDEDNAHGMQCFSAIAANLPGSFVGTAPNTSFYLYRTEDVASEYPIEEQNFAVALERADSLGVDITSTSLGYNQFDNSSLNYSYADMNGNTTISARAADFAAKKGILNVIAAGNEGSNAWRYLITPSDADSVLAVGAVDTLGNVAAFSSYGPSSDGQVKPSVAAVGLRAVVANPSNGQPSYGNGTSFACPNMAGLTTCLWQAFPEKNNMTIIDALEKSATRATNPDNRMGYGIPDMKKAFVLLQKSTYTQQLALNNCMVDISLSIKTDNSMKVLVERKLPSENSYTLIKTLQYTGTFSLRSLSYTDSPVPGVDGVINYRFKMEIGTDTTYYLDSTNILWPATCLGTAAENTVTIGPSPAKDILNVTIGRTEKADIEIAIYNSTGQQVTTRKLQYTAGLQQYTFNVAKLSKGAYIIKIFANNKHWVTRKFLHQ